MKDHNSREAEISDTKRNEGRMGIKEKIRKEIDTANFYKLNK